MATQEITSVNLKIMNFQVKNHGVKNIEFLTQKYSKLPVNGENVKMLKGEVFDSFINNPFIDFSTKGSVSVTIVDLESMTNCEIIYDNRYE